MARERGGELPRVAAGHLAAVCVPWPEELWCHEAQQRLQTRERKAATTRDQPGGLERGRLGRRRKSGGSGSGKSSGAGARGWSDGRDGDPQGSGAHGTPLDSGAQGCGDGRIFYF